jgi:hypothetical protein
MAIPPWRYPKAVAGINVKVAQATHEPPFSPRGRRVGGETGNSGSMLPARRTIPACKPECALQVEGETVMTFMIRGIPTCHDR